MSSHATPDDSKPQDQQLELGEDESAIALRKAWERTLRALANKINRPTFENWLQPLKPLSLEGDIVVLGAPSPFAREWVQKKYAQALEAQLEQYLGLPSVQLRFVISTPEVQPLLGEKPLPLQQAASPLGDLTQTKLAPAEPLLPIPADETAPGRASAPPSGPNGNQFLVELAGAPLIEKYTFEHFVVGKSNQLAYAGALAVAQSPGSVYNPLFLYGSPGLGKTHLMHAIGHHVNRALPHARVAYVSGETFTNHFVTALRDRRTEDFRRAYRSVDVWLIDDIQSIAAGQKEQTKEEFFHTFNTLHQMNRQIVIASDRSPRELRAMDERLRSRFMGGLVADIAPPDLEMRMAILQKKAILENLRIPDEVIAFMANLIQSNIRALEGALIKLMAYASLVKSPVTKQLASDVLSSYFVERLPPSRSLASAHPEDYSASADPQDRAPAHASVDQVVDAVAAQTGIDRELILSGGMRGGRLRGDAAFARQAAMYLAKEIGRIPMATLASAFGCRNHTSIAHAHARMREAMQNDPAVEAAVSRIRKVIEYSL